MEFNAPSSAKIVINPAPFIDAMALKNVIAKELAKAGFAFDPDKDLDFGIIISALLTVDSSDDVNRALFKCLSRCSYNGEKISEITFEPVDAREDYYDIILACVKENLSPFFKNLLSKLSPLMKLTTKSQKSA